VALYDDNNFHKLMADLKTLSTFDGVTDWDKQAQAEIERAVQAIQYLDNEIAENKKAIDQAKQAKSDKSFLGKLFSDDKEEKESAQKIEKYLGYQKLLNNVAVQLQESIDFTPNSPDEQKNLLKELKQRKKELQLSKREIAAAMKEMRTDARQQSADAGRTFGGAFYSSKMAAVERRHIKYAKEAALQPHESAKASVDRQLLQVERDIIWAEKFSG
jgi:hypothetical protein